MTSTSRSAEVGGACFAEARIRCYNLPTMNDKLAALNRLVEIVEKLRAPGGCPWDRQQTLRDMGRHMVEEVSEVVDAVENSGGTPSPEIREELGDVLMNVFLAATIAGEGRPGGESDAFDLTDVAEEVSEKLVRRHPHVFGDTKVDGVDEVLTNWNAIKAEERSRPRDRSGEPTGSRLDAVPRSLPPLVRAFELGRQAARAGFDWPDVQGALAKVEEELREVRILLVASGEESQGATSVNAASSASLQEELGDLLFAVVSLCRKSDIRPEEALRGTLRKFCHRFQAIERRFPDLEHQSLEAMEEVWRAEKKGVAASEEGRHCS